MELYYEGKNITQYADITKCIHRDMGHGRTDCLEMELEHAADWYRWGPKRDDRIAIYKDGYTTGTMYLNAVIPMDGKYRILATGLPSAARRKSWRSYENGTLQGIAATCAAECGMTSSLHGMNGHVRYPYLIRREEGPAAFMDRLLGWEGAVLKTMNGCFTCIDISYAQSLPATRKLTLKADDAGVRHLRRDDLKLAKMVLNTPYGSATATDTAVENGIYEMITDLPVQGYAEASRWARGLLLCRNRQAEELTLNTEFNAAYTAMVRIDIDSDSETAGEWIIDEAEHDLILGKSHLKLLRCITSIR